MYALCWQLAEQVLEHEGAHVSEADHAAHVQDLANDIQVAIDTWVVTHPEVEDLAHATPNTGENR